MKKILLITYYFPPKIGGGEEYLYNIYKRLPVDKVVVLADDKAGSAQVKFDKQQKFKIHRTNFFAGKLKPTWRPLIKIVKLIIQKENIKVIHFGHYAHYILLARIVKLPYLIYIQGSDFTSYSKSWFGRWLMKFNLSKAKLIITTSQFLKNGVVGLGVENNKIEVVHPWLDLEKYDFKAVDEGEIRESHLQVNDKKIILSVGRLHKVKGFDLVIKALPKILKQIPNAIYVIVGDGQEKENLKNLAVKQNIADKVIFAGEIKNKKELSKYYGSADVYAGPSRAEGFGIVFLEARAFSLPIVASDVGGVKEAVEDGGVLIKSEDVEDLSQNIVKVLKENKKYEPDKNFDWDKKMEKIKEILYENTV
ncbi:glycosyltransferase family 4 protein [Patescibacteria group bacterium]|nr:glycosyltransferase family 4 protein [Patescibacteria group bacterium]MBU4512916.1 glycosyltransferase family 4 protein [Patescibacteria group bacterium]